MWRQCFPRRCCSEIKLVQYKLWLVHLFSSILRSITQTCTQVMSFIYFFRSHSITKDTFGSLVSCYKLNRNMFFIQFPHLSFTVFYHFVFLNQWPYSLVHLSFPKSIAPHLHQRVFVHLYVRGPMHAPAQGFVLRRHVCVSDTEITQKIASRLQSPRNVAEGSGNLTVRFCFNVWRARPKGQTLQSLKAASKQHSTTLTATSYLSIPECVCVCVSHEGGIWICRF